MAVIPKGDGSGTKEVTVKLRGAGTEFPSTTSVGSGGGGLTAVVPKRDGSGTEEVAIKLRGAGIEFPSITSVGSGGGGHPGEAGNNPEWTLLAQHQPACNIRCTMCGKGTAVATWEDPLVPGHQAIRHSCMACQKDEHPVGPNGWYVALLLFVYDCAV